MSSDIQISKFLSYVLRHRPDEIEIELDAEGWVEVDALLTAARNYDRQISRSDLERLVRENDKQRFAFSKDGKKIRASQGHSVDIELGYEPKRPPELLYHGTVARFLDSIRNQGLVSGNRQHVHLSVSPEIATSVGQRRGKPVVLTVRAREMANAGHLFYESDNGVWLTEHVSPEFIDSPALV